MIAKICFRCNIVNKVLDCSIKNKKILPLIFQTIPYLPNTKPYNNAQQLLRDNSYNILRANTKREALIVSEILIVRYRIAVFCHFCLCTLL